MDNQNNMTCWVGHKVFLWIVILLFFSSCSSIRRNILFQTDGSIDSTAFQYSYDNAVRNYVIEPYDHLAISIYTNKGEVLVDPNREFEIGDAGGQQGNRQGGGFQQQQMQQGGASTNNLFNYPIINNNTPPRNYRINADGTAELPMIGQTDLAGLTLKQADSLLSVAYAEFYESPFVVSQYLNKRVIIMGALGDQVLPLRNERMTLLEVLALAGDVQNAAKPDKIRVIRGDLRKPSIQEVDLTTIAAMTKANLIVQPNDIIYVEPRRRIDRETFADFSTILTPLTAITSTVLTVILLVDRINE